MAGAVRGLEPEKRPALLVSEVQNGIADPAIVGSIGAGAPVA
jgi:hypothetical protein